jgi:hypothetical protein
VELEGEGVGAFAGAVVDDDGGAVVGEGGDGGAAGAAGADDGDAVVLQVVALDFQGGGDRVEDGGVVGGEAAELVAPVFAAGLVGLGGEAVDDDRVERADRLGEGVDVGALFLEVAEGVLLVGDGDREAGEVEGAEEEEGFEEGLEDSYPSLTRKGR